MPLTPYGQTQITIQLAPIRIIAPLNTSSMIGPRDLQQPHTPLNPIHNKVPPKFSLLLLQLDKFTRTLPMKMARFGHGHDRHHAEIAREANEGSGGSVIAVPVAAGELEAEVRGKGGGVHDAQFTAFARVEFHGFTSLGANGGLGLGGHADLDIFQPEFHGFAGFSWDVSHTSIFQYGCVHHVDFMGLNGIDALAESDI